MLPQSMNTYYFGALFFHGEESAEGKAQDASVVPEFSMLQFYSYLHLNFMLLLQS